MNYRSRKLNFPLKSNLTCFVIAVLFDGTVTVRKGYSYLLGSGFFGGFFLRANGGFHVFVCLCACVCVCVCVFAFVVISLSWCILFVQLC